MNELLNAGVELMLVGMGIVFVFLVLLVGVVNVMSFAIVRFSPEPVPSQARARQTTRPATDDAEIVAAITAAIQHHQSKL